MAEPLADRIIRRSTRRPSSTTALYWWWLRPEQARLPRSGHVSERTNAPLVNVNLELSRRMLDSTNANGHFNCLACSPRL